MSKLLKRMWYSMRIHSLMVDLLSLFAHTPEKPKSSIWSRTYAPTKRAPFTMGVDYNGYPMVCVLLWQQMHDKLKHCYKTPHGNNYWSLHLDFYSFNRKTQTTLKKKEATIQEFHHVTIQGGRRQSRYNNAVILLKGVNQSQPVTSMKFSTFRDADLISLYIHKTLLVLLQKWYIPRHLRWLSSPCTVSKLQWRWGDKHPQRLPVEAEVFSILSMTWR